MKMRSLSAVGLTAIARSASAAAQDFSARTLTVGLRDKFGL